MVYVYIMNGLALCEMHNINSIQKLDSLRAVRDTSIKLSTGHCLWVSEGQTGTRNLNKVLRCSTMFDQR